MKWKGLGLLMICLLLAGCGGGPKKDVSVFIMPETGLSTDIADKLELGLQHKMGDAPTVEVGASPIYQLEKLVVEIAAGGRSILIVPENDFESFAKQGGLVNLDSLFSPADYPQGMVEAPSDASNPNSPVEKHLYGIPVSGSKWMKDAGYNGKELFAFIHPRAPYPDKTKQVLQALAEK